MSDDAILKILLWLIYRENGSGDVHTTQRIEEAAQQIREYIDKEIIGEDEQYGSFPVGVYRNDLRAEQRQKLR